MLKGKRAMKAGRIQSSCRAGCFTEKQEQLIDAIISPISKQSSQPSHQQLRKVCRLSSHCASKSCSAAIRGHLPFKGYGLVVTESRGLIPQHTVPLWGQQLQTERCQPQPCGHAVTEHLRASVWGCKLRANLWLTSPTCRKQGVEGGALLSELTKQGL